MFLKSSLNIVSKVQITIWKFRLKCLAKVDDVDAPRMTFNFKYCILKLASKLASQLVFWTETGPSGVSYPWSLLTFAKKSIATSFF